MSERKNWRVRRIAPLAAALSFSAVIAGQSSPPVPYPEGYRSWRHVKSSLVQAEHASFPNRGGIHHFYANSKAVDGYSSGKFPNGSVIVDEGVFTIEGEGARKGIVQEGERRSLDVMIKDDRLFKDTGGWGFQHFDRSGRTGTLSADGQGKCFACHGSQNDRDSVFSRIRPEP